MGPKMTQAEGFILGIGAKMFSCCGARHLPCRQSGFVAHRPFGVPDIFLADQSAASVIDPGTRFCSAASATGSAEQRGQLLYSAI